jgi:hypothetical protein
MRQFITPNRAKSGTFTTDPDSSLNPNRQLLVKPDLNRGVLLEELEDKIDRWEKHFAPSSAAASIHLDLLSIFENPKFD